MIVIKTDHELEVGHVYGGGPHESLTDHGGEERGDFRFQVVSEATIEDYFKSVEIEAGIHRDDMPEEWTEGKRFYFVNMD